MPRSFTGIRKNFECPHAQGCELYGQFVMSTTLRIWQARYCHNEARHSKCARFIASAAGKPVPLTLLPNGESLEVE